LVANGPDDPLPYYYRPLTGWLYRARIEQALSLLTPPYESILELGYGSGVLLPTLALMSRRLHGIDLESDPEAVAASLQALGVTATLVRGDVREMDYPDGSFDLAVAISVFEHIRQPEAVLERIHRLLKPAGHLLVGMPRVDLLMEKAFRLIGYPGISAHHVTSRRQFLDAARGAFNLVGLARAPRLVPAFAALYWAMLLQRQEST